MAARLPSINTANDPNHRQTLLGMDKGLPEQKQAQMGNEQRLAEPGVRPLQKHEIQRQQQRQQQSASHRNQARRQR
jgi:hypothetical protein